MPLRDVADAAERELRAEWKQGGFGEPAAWVVEETRSGELERRQRRNQENMLRNRARLAQLRRDGYTFDSERRLVAPSRPVAQVPPPLESARPRERRAQPASRSRSSGDDEPSPEPLAAFTPQQGATAVARAFAEAGLR